MLASAFALKKALRRDLDKITEQAYRKAVIVSTRGVVVEINLKVLNWVVFLAALGYLHDKIMPKTA